MNRLAACCLMIILTTLLTTVRAANQPERIAFQRNEPAAITVMFDDGSHANDLPPSRLFTGPYTTPALSPDGVTILFSAKVKETYQLFRWRLNENNIAVGTPKQLITAASNIHQQFASCSPDGYKVAFLAIEENKTATLQLINSDGSGLHKLAEVSYLATPVWSADSKQLLYFNQLNGKPVLMNIPASGGTAIPFRTESNIIAADYSPDSKQLAAMIMQDNGLADLYILRPFGLGGGNAILKGIAGVKALIWREPEVLFFNAISVGEQMGKAFWEVNPEGEILRGLTGYSDPKNVSYFSRQRSDLTPYVPEPDIIIPLPLPLPDDNTAKILASPVMILSPKNGDIVRGSVPLRIISRHRTAKVVIRINGQLIYAESTANFGERQNVDIPRLTYNWNTQGIRPPGAFSSLPASYRELQNYPDAGYAICVQGVDESDRLIGQQIITVQVRNEVERPADENTFDLQYSTMKERSQEIYQLNASANLFDAEAHLSSSLNANLQAFLQRTVDIVLPNGNIGLRTTITSPEKRYPLIYGQNALDIPETTRAVYGAYSLTPFGDILLATLQNEKIYLPIAQLSVPLKGSRITVGDSWQKAMMVVPDLFTRESNNVAARHTLEGIEWIENRQMARIRSEFVLDKFTTLYPMPANTVPGEQGERTALIKKLNSIIIPNAPPDPLTTVPAISVQRAAGVRYSWFDLQTQKLWRVEDIIIITIPAANVPDLPRTTLSNGEVSETLWYQVRLQYQLEEPRLPVN